MKKFKVKKLMVITLACLSITAGSTFAWYIAKKTTNSVSVTAGWVKIGCAGELVNVENLLPGESAYLNPEAGNPGGIVNNSSTAIIAELTFEGQKEDGTDLVSGTLPIGAKPDPAYIGVDYVLNTSDNLYHFTQKRLKEVVYPEMVIPSGSRYTKINDRYYISIEKAMADWPQLEKIYLRLLPELGGNYIPPGSSTRTPDRPYENEARFVVYYRLTGVQKTKQAVIDLFGDEVAKLYFK